MEHELRSGNVPVPATPMIGRHQLLGQVVELVRANRLVTLTGVGGVGKTRLAVEAGRLLADEFDGGVWMVELAAIADPAALPDVAASSLGIVPQSDAPVIDAVADALVGRRVLLVLDNCEHVSEAVAVAVERILERSSTAHILATSRESIWVAGEQRLAMSPLEVERGVESEAVELFVERAQAVRYGFGLDEQQTADAVVESCRTLDGLPLAIELAAARMASMTAVELQDRLQHRFRLLTTVEDRPQRQRTLEAMVAWSYDLLDPAERNVLGSVSVFRGGFDLVGLVDVMGGTDEIDVLVTLDSLVHKSLVVAEPGEETTRYHLLETIRQFAEDRLVADGRLVELRDRHARSYASVAATQWEHWNGPGWRRASDWTETELGNLRAAFRWSRDREEVDVATDVAAHAALMGVTIQLFEPVGWAEELLDVATAANVTRLPRLHTAAGYACFAGRPALGAERAHIATRLERDPYYDPCEPGLAAFVEALACVYAGDLDRYVQLTAAVAELPGPARAYGLPAYVDGLQASGRVEEAVALTEQSVAAARQLGNPFWIVYALWTAGLAHAHADPKRALAAWDEGVDTVREHGVDFFAGFLARDAARLHAIAGDADTALALFTDAIEQFRTAGNVAQLIVTVASIPAVFERLGRFGAAATLLAAITREPAALHHVPDLADLPDRLACRLDPEALASAAGAGASLDLDEAADYARAEIEVIRGELAQERSAERPGGLSRREVEVLRLVADGLTTREIGAQLFISAKTADHHIQHIYTKIGASSRAAATRWAIENGVVLGTAPG